MTVEPSQGGARPPFAEPRDSVQIPCISLCNPQIDTDSYSPYEIREQMCCAATVQVAMSRQIGIAMRYLSAHAVSQAVSLTPSGLVRRQGSDSVSHPVWRALYRYGASHREGVRRWHRCSAGRGGLRRGGADERAALELQRRGQRSLVRCTSHVWVCITVLTSPTHRETPRTCTRHAQTHRVNLIRLRTAISHRFHPLNTWDSHVFSTD
jgi:hypothetical protein